MLKLVIVDGHDSAVSLIDGHKAIYAASEERFSRRKKEHGFPVKSLSYISNDKSLCVDEVYIISKYGRALYRGLNSWYSRSNPIANPLSFLSCFLRKYENIVANNIILKNIDFVLSRFFIKRILKKNNIHYTSLKFIEHHYAHILSSLIGIDSDTYFALSLDAYGDGLSGLFFYVKNNVILEEDKIFWQNSVAHVYAVYTAYLGFQEGDEGKVMALAEKGKYSEAFELTSSLFSLDKGRIKVSNEYLSLFFKRKLLKEKKENIAYALQRNIENIIIEYLHAKLEKYKVFKVDLFLSGGIFTNVKLNQKLNNTDRFYNIFVVPNMGDGGAVLAPVAANIQKAENKVEDMFLGPSFDDEYIESVLKYNKNVCYKHYADIMKKIAVLLADGNIVGCFWGKMEFGPRALGNRSILYHPSDNNLQHNINKILGREFFMPFAPVVLEEYADELFYMNSAEKRMTEFMTTTVKVKDKMKSKYPALVYIDDTSRVQIVNENNKRLYGILKEYYEITGNPLLLNTSFNIHGEPIVCFPEEALKTFLTTDIDCLIMNDFHVTKLSVDR